MNSVANSAVSTSENAKVPEPTTCPDYTDNFSTPYKYCDSGSDVRSIQQALVRNGYSVDVDGYYGPGTRAAVKRYQSSQGLLVTGQVNTSTWSSLMSGDAPQPDYSDEGNLEYEEPSQPIAPPVVTQQKQVTGVICDLRESGMSSSWHGQSYYWTYYYLWSDGSRTVAKMGQGYDPPYDCL